MAKKKSEADLIKAVCGERKLREAAAWFNEKLPEPFQRSHMSVKYWQDGMFKPDNVFLHGLRTYYAQGDERHEMAVAILRLRSDTSAHWVGMSPENGKKLLGAVKIRTMDDGTVVHEGEA